MKQLAFFVFMLSLGACGDDDDTAFGCIELDYQEPEYLEDVNFIEITNTPTVQIERFVSANNLDTVHTPSGLVYSIIDAGEAEKPEAGAVVEVWYKEYLANGSIFAQSNVCSTGPLRATLNIRTLAWQEGVRNVGRGGKIMLLARPSLAFGSSSPSSNSFIVVSEVELLDFENL